MSAMDHMHYIALKVEAREKSGLQAIAYSRPESVQPSKHPKIAKPSKKNRKDKLMEGEKGKDDAASMMSNSSANSLTALLRDKIRRNKK